MGVQTRARSLFAEIGRAFVFAPDDAAGAAGSGTEPGPSWGGQYEHRALAAPPAPQFRSDLDSGRTASLLCDLQPRRKALRRFRLLHFGGESPKTRAPEGEVHSCISFFLHFTTITQVLTRLTCLHFRSFSKDFQDTLPSRPLVDCGFWQLEFSF